MTRRLARFGLLLLALSVSCACIPAFAGGRCTGSPNCTACTNCSRCRHCAIEGGTCGVKEAMQGGKQTLKGSKQALEGRKTRLPRATRRTLAAPVETDGDEDAPRAGQNAVVSAGSIRPGVERWSIKITTDREAKDIKPTPKRATVEQMASLSRPADMPLTGHARQYEHHRAAPVETTTYAVTATITAYKAEPDGDFHVVLTGKSGQTMIVEVPSPLFVPRSNPRWSQIAAVRGDFQRRFHPLTRLKHCRVPAIVTGVGFFDFYHRQTGVAPNAVELHPVTGIFFK